jgi:hypothetical protein
MKSRTHFSSLVLGSLLLAVGCAKPAFDVSAVFDPLATFPSRATVSWDDKANHPPDNPELQSHDYDRLLKQISNEEFAKRGYTSVATGAADYLLSYELTIHRWISAEKTQATGTLSLSLVDTRTHNRVWLGYGRAQVLVGLSEKERSERLRLILVEMLKDFPPHQRGDE